MCEFKVAPTAGLQCHYAQIILIRVHYGSITRSLDINGLCDQHHPSALDLDIQSNMYIDEI